MIIWEFNVARCLDHERKLHQPERVTFQAVCNIYFIEIDRHVPDYLDQEY
jgi:hypothetical protein